MATTPLSFNSPTVMVLPWHDPIVDAHGHDVHGTYVELFWLNVLGPTATWTLRRLVAGLGRYPLGYELDLDETASALGLSYSPHTSGTFVRALQRCIMFGAARTVPEGLAVRRRLPTVAARHLERMPPNLRELHSGWQVRECSIDELRRATALAEVMVDAGDDTAVVERQLLAVGVPPAAASAAADVATSRSSSPGR